MRQVPGVSLKDNDHYIQIDQSHLEIFICPFRKGQVANSDWIVKLSCYETNDILKLIDMLHGLEPNGKQVMLLLDQASMHAAKQVKEPTLIICLPWHLTWPSYPLLCSHSVHVTYHSSHAWLQNSQWQFSDHVMGQGTYIKITVFWSVFSTIELFFEAKNAFRIT